MIKDLLKSKKYLFIGTLLTAGVIAGITYNIILSNNNSLQVSDNLSTKEINYNDLQQQIDELRTSLENTQNELDTTKEQLSNANNEIIDLNIQIASLSDSNKEVTTKVIKVEGTAQNANTNVNEAKDTANNTASQFQNVYEKDLKQKELVLEKENLEKEKSIFDDRLSKEAELNREKSNLKAEKTKLEYNLQELYYDPNYDIDAVNQTIKELEEKLNSAKTEYEKNRYRETIDKLKAIAENQPIKKEKAEKLQNEIKELEKSIENIDNKIKQVSLSEEENKRYNEICNRIENIQQELLKY